MANMPSNVPPTTPAVPVAPTTTRSTGTASATSKMALLLSFAAGAAFSWILMQSVDDEEPVPQTTTVAAPGSVTIQRR